MIHRSLFGRAGWGRFSGLVGGAYGRCSTDTNPTTPMSDFSYALQSAADQGAAAHGRSTRQSFLHFSRASPRNGHFVGGAYGRCSRAMFNGHKPHHPNDRFFLCFAERRGPGCCCAWADKKGRLFKRFLRYGPRNGQLGS